HCGPEQQRYAGHRNRPKVDLLAMLQLSYSVAQESCESCNFLSKRFQSSLLDCVGCDFCDDEGALPIVLAIEQDENFAHVDVAKGLSRISGSAADPHPHHIHRSAEIDHFEACTLADYRMAPVSPNRQLGEIGRAH